MELTGDVLELEANMKILWNIKDFSPLWQEANFYYNSPKFYFSGASWQLQIFQNGYTDDKSGGFISVYLQRKSSGTAVTVHCFISLKIDEVVGPSFKFRKNFHKKDEVYKYSDVILSSPLMERLTDSKHLSVICTLTHCQKSNVEGSLFTRHQELCDNLKDIYDKCKKADCTLKVDGCDIPAHRVILESRSPVFAAKLTHDMKVNGTGKISIDDMGKCEMESILMHMYTGDIDNPTKENVLRLYETADEYSIKYVKQICVDFVKNNLSVVKKYFYENAPEIFGTEMWNIFSEENPEISNKLVAPN